jgi:hypothetical protein
MVRLAADSEPMNQHPTTMERILYSHLPDFLGSKIKTAKIDFDLGSNGYLHRFVWTNFFIAHCMVLWNKMGLSKLDLLPG